MHTSASAVQFEIGRWRKTYLSIYWHLLRPSPTTSRTISAHLWALGQSSGAMLAVWSMRNYLQPNSSTMPSVDREGTLPMNKQPSCLRNKSGPKTSFMWSHNSRTGNVYKTIVSAGADA